jgi:hypothetical protein
MEHPGIASALRTAAHFERRYPDIDERRAAYDDLEHNYAIDVDPRDLRDLRVLSRTLRAVMRDVISLADAVCVRSHYEHEIVQIIFEMPVEPVFTAPIERTLPPLEPEARRYAIVVWAPHLRADDCALFAAAFADARTTVFIVSSGKGVVPNGNVQFVGIEHAGDALSHAAVVVDTTMLEPSWAIAFARAGFGVVACTSSGAHEYLEGAGFFEPWQRGALARAVARVRGLPPPRVRDAAPAERRAITTIAQQGPRVTVRVPGRDARERRAIGARLRYENLEVQSADARTDAALTLDVAAEDDLFPDAVGRLVDALERAGASSAEGPLLRSDRVVRLTRAGRADVADVVRVNAVVGTVRDPI